MITKLLNLFEPEISHKIVKKIINKLPERKISYDKFFNYPQFFNVKLRNPLGLAAGFDKNCDMIMGIKKLGFGFCEVGTITPFYNEGHKGKRIIKLNKEKTIFNKMGLPSEGFESIKNKLLKINFDDFVVGVNIGLSGNENISSKNDLILNMIEQLNNIKSCSYITINFSCQNVKNIMNKDDLEKIFKNIKKTKPVFVKFSVDMEEEELISISKYLLNMGCSGFIIGNTSKKIPDELIKKNYIDGSMSGKFIQNKSNHLILSLREKLGKDFIIIGSGGILTPEDAYIKMMLGANLLQIYTGFIFNGPKIINDILNVI